MAAAIGLLKRKVRLLDVSTFCLTEPVGSPSFYNGAVKIETEIPPILI